MGYIPQVFDTSPLAASHTEGTVVTLARLNVSILKVIYCFCDDSVDKVGDHWQKLSLDTFSLFLPVVFSQFIETFATIVLESCREKLKVFSLETYASSFIVSLSSLRSATEEVFLPSPKLRLVAVSPKQFVQRITQDMSTILDCYIADHYESNNEKKLLGYASGSDAKSCRASNYFQY